ncbi:P-loop NTPase fold protein [uncultured Aquimarina sp.]|uniref:P-loop NTPase fold protein n=1 Tax=uncultured Aquimarina sp. TaxID=575652 RepID=UPI002625B237|nr:P-loop NTPase fold protein [uncultured Aquimarina sp.]
MIEKLNSNTKRLGVIYFVVIAIFLIFKPEIEVFLANQGGSFSLDHFSFIIGYIIICFVILIWYAFALKKKYRFNPNHEFTVILGVTLYTLLRFNTDNIVFLPEEISIKYLDIVFLIFLLHFVAFLIHSLHQPRETLNPTHFIEDLPFKDGVIENEDIVENLITTLNGFRPSESFSIGINAVWGYGKTTFLKRFEQKIRQENHKTIVFWYKLWRNDGDTAIIENFFNEFKKQLAQDSGEFSNTINKYVDAIVAYTPDMIQKIATTGKNILNKDETLEEYHKNINDGIKKIDKQIVVLLDDLDRLDENEILQSFKLIRTLADFNNVVFIAGYHRKYVTSSIENDNYLDKIFNVEINLLPFREKRIKEELLVQINKVFPKDVNAEDVIGYDTSFEGLFLKGNKELQNQDINLTNVLSTREYLTPTIDLNYQFFLKTFRDVKRFVNEFKFNEKFLEDKKNVVLKEYILLKLCVYKYRELQNLVFSELDSILSKGAINLLDRDQEFSADSLGLYGPPDIYVYDQNVREKISKKIKDNTSYTEEDIEIIDAVLIKLFGEKSKPYYETNQNCIAKISYTNIYVRNNVAGALFKITDFINAFKANNLHKILMKYNGLTLQSLYNAQNELKLFIFRGKITDKNQFKDVLKTIDRMDIVTQSEDRQHIIDLSVSVLKNTYEGNQTDFLKDFKEVVLSSSSIGSIDNLLGDININEKRLERKELYNESGIVKYENEIFKDEFLKEVLTEKLNRILKNESLMDLKLSGYHLYTEKIVAVHKIIRSKEVNLSIKNDILNEGNFNKYLEDGFFDFTAPSDGEPPEQHKYQPKPFLDQMYSNPETLDLLIADPHNEKLYTQFSNEGWDNYYKFLKSVENPVKNDGNYTNERLEKIKRLMKKYIEKGYMSLTSEEYNSIWNQEISSPRPSRQKQHNKGKY